MCFSRGIMVSGFVACFDIATRLTTRRRVLPLTGSANSIHQRHPLRARQGTYIVTRTNHTKHRPQLPRIRRRADLLLLLDDSRLRRRIRQRRRRRSRQKRKIRRGRVRRCGGSRERGESWVDRRIDLLYSRIQGGYSACSGLESGIRGV